MCIYISRLLMFQLTHVSIEHTVVAGAHTFGRVQCTNIADAATDRLYNFSGTNRPDPTRP
jgi:hypothetical protein